MTYALQPDARLRDTLAALMPSARAEVEYAGAYALYELVRRHVLNYARAHHHTAELLGAQPTRHIEDGRAAISCRGNSVEIPIPGFSRAFHDVDVYPRRAKALTIPINRISYGVRAGLLASEGWNIFRVATPGGTGSGILFGRKEGESESVALYLLRSHAQIKQDRSMLPSDEEMHSTSAAGVARAILRRAAS